MKGGDLMTRRQYDIDAATNFPIPSNALQRESVAVNDADSERTNRLLVGPAKGKASAGNSSSTSQKRIEITKVNKDKSKDDPSNRIFRRESPDEEGSSRSRRLRKNKNSQKRKLIVYSIIVVLVLIICFTLSMIPVPLKTDSVKRSLEFIDTMVSFSMDVKMAYFVFLESMVNKKAIIVDGQPIFGQLAVKVSDLHNQMAQKIDSIPQDFNSYQTYVKQVMLENACTQLLEPKYGITSRLRLTASVPRRHHPGIWHRTVQYAHHPRGSR